MATRRRCAPDIYGGSSRKATKPHRGSEICVFPHGALSLSGLTVPACGKPGNGWRCRQGDERCLHTDPSMRYFAP
ncbi:hypothetical protein MPLSOD_150062 [Mesorhizobium sp. SOD10]|nr:hypothetical protein MPLSOD_150062 [Mesorhizobium sp. SOD10]